MEENGGIDLRNWGFLEPRIACLKSHLGLQLMPSKEEKPFYGVGTDGHFHHQQQQLPHQLNPTIMAASTKGGPYQHHWVGGVLDSPMPISYIRDSWFGNHLQKFFNVLPNYQYQQSQLDSGLMPRNSLAHPVQLIQQSNSLKNENAATKQERVGEETDAAVQDKKRGSGKANKPTKAKKPKKDPRAPREECSRSVHRSRAPKRSAEVIINGNRMDICEIAVPVCTCTGTPQQCYRWGAGGWQSACCTTSMSMYPLPMSSKRRGARIIGRKMSFGAFRKVLEKLASEGYDFSNPVDLRTYWAKHGTNKFVIVR